MLNLRQIVTIPAGTPFTRLVGEPASKDKEFLKYKPADLVKSPMRASFANQSVFYGCLSDDNNTAIYHRLTLAVSECSGLFRSHKSSPDSCGIDKFVGSEWVSDKDLDFVSLIHPDIFKNVENDLLSEIKQQYEKLISQLPDGVKSGYDSFTKFFAEKFSEEISPNEVYKYNLTAAFAQSMFLKYDGIIYPSVQSQGQLGLNIALRPKTVDEHITLQRTCSVYAYKYKENMLVGDENTTDAKICYALGIPSIDVIR